MRQRHEYLLVLEPRQAHIILHHRVAAVEGVLGLQPIPDPLRRVPLLLVLDLIVFQNLVDDPQPGPQLRFHHWLFPGVAWRDRIGQHFPDGLARQPELPRCLPDAHPIHLNRSSYARIHFHLVHLLVSHKHNYPVMFWNRSVVVYFSTATKCPLRGASWSIITPPFISC